MGTRALESPALGGECACVNLKPLLGSLERSGLCRALGGSLCPVGAPNRSQAAPLPMARSITLMTGRATQLMCSPTSFHVITVTSQAGPKCPDKEGSMAAQLMAVPHPWVGPCPSGFSSLVFCFYPEKLLILKQMGLQLVPLIFQCEHGILLADTWNYFCCVCMAEIP